MSKTVLIVDDEKALSKALSLKLQKEGYDTIIADDGTQAVDILKKEKIDLVLLDLVMPNMDGFGVLEEAKKLKTKAAIIVSSNLSQNEDITRAKELGAKDFFVKSDTPLSEVVKRVQSTLGA